MKTQSSVLRLMRKYRIPLTRPNLIYLSYMGAPPSPENWTCEDEAELPRRFQRAGRARPPRKRRRR